MNVTLIVLTYFLRILLLEANFYMHHACSSCVFNKVFKFITIVVLYITIISLYFNLAVSPMSNTQLLCG